MKSKKIIPIFIVIVAIVGVAIFMILNGNTASSNGSSNQGGSSGVVEPGNGNSGSESHSHNWVLQHVQDSTCYEVGYKEFCCDYPECTEIYTEEIALKDHKIQVLELVEPGCFETGLTEGEICSVCEMIITEQVEIPVREHQFVNEKCIHCGNDYYTPDSSFELNEDGSGYIYETYNETDTVVIPDVYNGVPVTSFELHPDTKNTLETIIIGDNIKEITFLQFQHCTNLTSIHIGDGVEIIDEFAFDNCSSLTTIIIPDSVREIGENAFIWCTNLKKVYIGNGIEVIKKNTFNTSTLDELIIGDKVKIIEDDAFYFAKNVILPNGIEYIGSGNFHNIDEMESINTYQCGYYIGSYTNPYLALVKTEQTYATTFDIHENCKIIYESAFQYKDNLESIILPEKIVQIGKEAFIGCLNLSSLELNNKLKYIDENIIITCENLKYLYIPSSVIQIKHNSMPYVSTVTVDYRNEVYDSRDGCDAIIETASDKLIAGSSYTRIPDDVQHIGEYAFSECHMSTIKLPNGLISIEEQAFAHCNNLQNITIPNNVLKIAKSAFTSCPFLSRVTIGDSLKVIENGTFSSCTLLREVTFGEKVEKIESNAFEGCILLEKINITKNLTNIEISAFSGCRNIQIITVDEENSVYDSREDCNAIIETATNTLIVASLNTTIPTTVTKIGIGVYWNWYITTITIPDNIEYIDSHAFFYCENLKNITLSKNLKSIGAYAFANCTILKDIYLPKTLEYISSSAFDNSGLEKIYFEGTIDEWNAIEKENAFEGSNIEVIFNYTM